MADAVKLGIHILVVDTDARAAASQVQWLRAAGYNASAAVGFQAASIWPVLGGHRGLMDSKLLSGDHGRRKISIGPIGRAAD